MSRLFYLIGVAVITLCPLPLTAGEALFSDDFIGKLQPGWSWIREDKSAWRTTDSGLEIRIQRGNMWGPENSGKNVLVRELPKTDKPLEISVTVEHRPTEQYEQVDLVAYYDDSHMVKIGEELVDGKLSIVMGREEKDRARTIAIIPLEKNRVELKFRIEGRNVSGYLQDRTARPIGRRLANVTCRGSGMPKVALQCYQGSDEKEHWAKIQRFRIDAVKPN